MEAEAECLEEDNSSLIFSIVAMLVSLVLVSLAVLMFCVFQRIIKRKNKARKMGVKEAPLPIVSL